MVQQEVLEKNIFLERQLAQLHANVDKLWYHLCQKNMDSTNLQRTYLIEKNDLIALDNNKIFKMENELMKVKSIDSQKKNANMKRKCESHEDSSQGLIETESC